MTNSTRRPTGDPTRGAISIACPWCGSTVQAGLSDLRLASSITCGGCDTTVGLDRIAAIERRPLRRAA